MKLINDERRMISIYFARILNDNGKIIDGVRIWNEYKELMENADLPYSEKTVRLHDIRSRMNMFIYQFKDSDKKNIEWNEQIGDIYYIEDGEIYFDDNGVLKREEIGLTDQLFI